MDIGMFVLVNKIPTTYSHWHNEALDNTANDVGGYMYFVDVGAQGSQIFNSTIDDLCIGLRYEFFVYLANVIRKQHNLKKSNIRFEIRTTTVPNNLIAQWITGDIPSYDNMTWSKYGLSFIASDRSVILLMISNATKDDGNDIAIDDIEFRVCSTTDSGFCPQS
jgi:hypothetical protein